MEQHHAPADSVEQLAESFVEESPPEVDLSGHTIEDWVTFATFWILCGVVFLQFFTRYALNNSAAWTEEAARYLLVFVVFLGSSMCVRLDRHIQVDLLYRYLPRTAGRVLVTGVDALRVSLSGYCVWLTWQVKERVGSNPMTMIDWPMSVIHWVVIVAFALMFYRALVVAVTHLRTGTSILESPDHVVDGV